MSGVRGCLGKMVYTATVTLRFPMTKWVVGNVLVTSFWKHIELLKLLVDLCEHIQQSCCREIGHVVRGVIDWCKMYCHSHRGQGPIPLALQRTTRYTDITTLVNMTISFLTIVERFLWQCPASVPRSSSVIIGESARGQPCGNAFYIKLRQSSGFRLIGFQY